MLSVKLNAGLALLTLLFVHACSSQDDSSAQSHEAATADDWALRVVSATYEQGVTKVKISWDGVEGATRYHIHGSPSEPPVVLAAKERGFEATIDHEAQYQVSAIGPNGAIKTTPAFKVYSIRQATYTGQPAPLSSMTMVGPIPVQGYVSFPNETLPVTGPVPRPFPLVLLLHGRATKCHAKSAGEGCPLTASHDCAPGVKSVDSARGMTYLANALAAQGYVAVAVRADAVNCLEVDSQWQQDLKARQELVVAHVKEIARQSNDPTHELYHRVDLKRVGLIGHSRGADAAALVPPAFDAGSQQIQVRSVLAVSPSGYDATALQAGDWSYGVVAGGCDGDINNRGYFDAYEYAEAGKLLKGELVQVYLEDANHISFNEVWAEAGQPDNQYHPSAGCNKRVINPAVQRTFLSSVVGRWFNRTLAQAPSVEPFLRLDAALPESITTRTGPLRVSRSYAPSERLSIYDFGFYDRVKVDAPVFPPSADVESTLYYDSGKASGRLCVRCSPLVLHAKPGLHFTWSESTSFGFAFPALDASRYNKLSFSLTSLQAEAPVVQVVLLDNAGKEALVNLSDVMALLLPDPTHANAAIFQTVHIPLTRFSQQGVDLTQLVRVEFRTLGIGEALFADIDLIK